MGTSKANSGPSKHSSLLPDWAKDEENQNNPEDTNNDATENSANNHNSSEHASSEPDWKNVRGAFTSYFKSSNDKLKLNRALSRYVKTSGGAKKLSNSVLSGKSSAIKLGGFLNDISQNGYEEAFKKLGIADLTGKSIDVTFVKLAETLSPKGNEADDPYARSAIAEALSKIYEDYELSEKDLSELDNLNENKIHEFLEYYIESYISERLIAEMGKTLENKDFSEREVIDKEFEMKIYLKEAVKLEFRDIDLNNLDLSDSENAEKISDIFETAYSIMETL